MNSIKSKQLVIMPFKECMSGRNCVPKRNFSVKNFVNNRNFAIFAPCLAYEI